MSTLYIKDGQIKTRSQIVIKSQRTIKDKDGNEKVVGTNTFFPSEELILANGWEKYEMPQPTEEELFQREKQHKLNEIRDYDSSREVNNFYIGEHGLWLDKLKRTGLILRFNSELAAKHEITTLWHEDMKFTLPINDAIAMLYALELYASACYDNTQRHIANVNSLTTIEEIQVYDYRSGYPEMLRFKI
ncbi:MAG: DUF4376 domain-containing protein [Lachnospiraceae bacterium]|nr:DUF4376 domain-containing protein [Lachnospiraceae bacterium]